MDKMFVTLDTARQVICDACGRPGCPRLWGNDCDRIDRLIAISAAADVRPVVHMFVEEKQPELIDLPERKGKNRFKYFE